MNFLRYVLKKEITKEISAIIFIAIFLYSLRNIIDLLLLTLLFTYLIYNLEKSITRQLKKYIKVKELFITIVLYLIIFMILVYFICKYVPIIVNQSIIIMNELIEEKSQFNIEKVEQYLYPLIGRIDIKSYVQNEVSNIFELVSELGELGINIILALILSMFFMIEKADVIKILCKFKTSRVSVIYKYVSIFSRDFFKSFGKVIHVQMITALTNAVISLAALSMMKFPQFIALAFMVFAFSLIPIVGIILSLVPLSIIAFNIGGIVKVVYVLSMIVILWAIESYVLTPQFMYEKTQIPVFFVFIILIISQHFMGMWGLLVGIPLFMFGLHMFGINLNKK